MTLEELKANTAFNEGWGNVWPGLRAFLVTRLITKAASGKCVIESSQAESAVQKELALLLRELETIGRSVSDMPTGPTMKPLHSMSGDPNTK